MHIFQIISQKTGDHKKGKYMVKMLGEYMVTYDMCQNNIALGTTDQGIVCADTFVELFKAIGLFPK